MMKHEILFIIIGYLSGSILFAEVTARSVGKKDMLRQSRDGNPGTASAFGQCGFVCGVITLIGDLMKGFLPIFCYTRLGGDFQTFSWLKILVIAAPVIGHAFPLFFGFRGGKAIAVTFGCLLGLLPIWQPLVIHAAIFVFFSVVIRINPHYYRTIITYLASTLGMFISEQPIAVILGFVVITAVVLIKHFKSVELIAKPQIKLLWMH